MMCVVLVDATGAPLRPALIWADQRAAAGPPNWKPSSVRTPATVTGNRLAAAPHRLMWLQRHEPEVVARAYRAIGHKDFVNARLTGIIATDVSDASSTAMYDITDNSWSDE